MNKQQKYKKSGLQKQHKNNMDKQAKWNTGRKEEKNQGFQDSLAPSQDQNLLLCTCKTFQYFHILLDSEVQLLQMHNEIHTKIYMCLYNLPTYKQAWCELYCQVMSHCD